MRLDELADLNMGQSPCGKSLNETDGIEFHQGKIYFGDLELGHSPIKTNAPTKKAKPGDILICVRAPVGVVNITDHEVCIGRGLAALTPKPDVPARFLLHLLWYRRQAVEQIATGSTFASITTDQLRAIDFPVPDKESRLRIAGILGSLDEKIELNRKKIAELEALAKTIYDYWFVQFDFPDKNGKPYKSSGGKMVWSEQLKREVPEGWEVMRLESCCSIKSGYPFKANEFLSRGKYGILTIRNVQEGFIDHKTESFRDDWPRDMPPEFCLRQGDILMSLTGYVGRIGIVTQENYLLNQRVALVTPQKTTYHEFVYEMLRSGFMRTRIVNLANGCAQQNVSPLDCGKLLFPVCNSVVEKYHSVCSIVMQEYIRCMLHTSELISCRDTLLPLLMNGQVEVAG